MKKSLTILLLSTGLAMNAQSSVHYKFKLNAVTNLAEAKLITDPLRSHFKTYPTFVDATDDFEFDSYEDVTQAALSSLLNGYGYSIAEFSKQTNIEEPVISTKVK
jgi:hypothetical protein